MGSRWLYLTSDPYCVYSTDLVDTKNYNMYLWETVAGDEPMICEDCQLLSDTVHVPQVSMMVLDVKI